MGKNAAIPLEKSCFAGHGNLVTCRLNSPWHLIGSTVVRGDVSDRIERFWYPFRRVEPEPALQSP